MSPVVDAEAPLCVWVHLWITFCSGIGCETTKENPGECEACGNPYTNVSGLERLNWISAHLEMPPDTATFDIVPLILHHLDGPRGLPTVVARSLVQWSKDHGIPRSNPRVPVIFYKLIARWPVPVYLTTNYDDEIQAHLAELGETYLPYSNSEDHMAYLLPDLSGALFNLHGDLRSEKGLR